MSSLLPLNEIARLAALHQYEILDTAAEQSFDDLTLLAAQICGTPIALISLADAERLWFKSRVGMAATEISRERAFCAHAIMQSAVFTVCDAHADERFAQHPLVISDPHIRFYAGAPLVAPDGHALGTLCVLDYEPRQLKQEQTEALHALSRQVVTHLELRRNAAVILKTATAQAERAAHESEEFSHAVLKSLTASIAVLDREGEIIAVNEAWTRFACDNSPEGALEHLGVGVNYFAICERASGASIPEARAVADGIRAVIAGSLPHFTLEYPCHSASKKRWFLMSVTQLSNARGGAVVSHLDISEQKTAEETREAALQALHEGEERFRKVFESAPIGMVIVDTDYRITKANKTFCEMLDYDEHELKALTLKDVTHPDDIARDLRMIEQMFCGERQSYKLEKRYLTKSGEPIWINLTATVIRDQHGQVLYGLGMIENIAERKWAGEAIRQSENKYRALMEQASDGIHTYDARGRLLRVNSTLCEMLGYTRGELLGLNVSDLVPEDDLASSPIRYEDLRAGMSLLTERRLRRKNGTLLPVEISGKMLEGGSFQAIIRDVSERKRVEAALRESEERFRQLAENICEVFWLSSSVSDELIYVSPGYEEVWGDMRENLYAAPRSWLDAVHPEDRERVREAAKVKQPRGDYDEQYRLVRPDGSLRWIHDRAFPIRNGAGEVYRIAGVAADITARKHVEAALRASEERFFLAFNASPEPMAITDFTDGRYLFVNDSFLRATGYHRGEMTGRSTVELNLWADPSDSERLINLLTAQGRIYREEVNIRLKSGEIRMGLFSAEIIEVLGERCIITLTHDITERKQAEKRLAAQYAVTRVLADAMTLSEATPQLLRAICQSLNWSLGALWYVDRREGALHCVELWQDETLRASEFVELSRRARYAPNTGFPSHIWASGTSIWVADIAGDNRFPRAHVAAKEGLHGAVGFPIRLGDEILGVMEFFSSEIRPPDEDLLNMMSTIGSQIGQFAVRKRAEEGLQKAHAELEVRVLERTAELAAVNSVLQAEVVERKQVEAARAQLLRRLVTAHEEERRRIARELHDKMGQYLTALILGLHSLKDTCRDQAGADVRLQRLLKITDELVQEVHHLAWELRPAALDDLGLQTALANYITQWSERAEIVVDFHSANLDQQRLPPEIETTVYRIVQEALTNVLKHAHAGRVSIIVECRQNFVHAIIEDNGSGFEAERVLSGTHGGGGRLGLLGMQERVALVAGALEIESSPGVGTTVFARIPFTPEAQGVAAHE